MITLNILQAQTSFILADKSIAPGTKAIFRWPTIDIYMIGTPPVQQGKL